MTLLERTRRPAGSTHGSGLEAGGEVKVVPGAESRGAPPSPAASGGRLAVRGSVAQRRLEELRHAVRTRLAVEVGASAASREEVAAAADALLTEVAIQRGVSLTRSDRQTLVAGILDDVLGLGPLEPLFADPGISDILVNDWDRIYVERNGVVMRCDVTFDDRDHLLRVIDRIVSRVGRRVDESSPMVDARLDDGARVHVVVPPVALSGPTLTIRRFAATPLEVEDLVRLGTATPEMITFLRAAVRARLNIVVSGGGSSGKTTTLNVLSGFIPDDERIVTIEDVAELQLRQVHVVPLETRPANIEGKGRVTVRDLVINALRMRPDRIVVGECRGAEALDMLQAMNTGHDGSLTTAHANSPPDVVARLEVMVLMAGNDLPSKAIREQIASAIQLIVHQVRLRDGSRKIVSISEVVGMHQGRVQLQEIFAFRQTGLDDSGRVLGVMGATGVVPRCLPVLVASGNAVGEALFAPAVGLATGKGPPGDV